MNREQVLSYVAERYDTEPDFPWSEYPRHAVLRHRDTRKWYGLVMDVTRDKLGLEGEGSVSIVNVKCDPGVVYLSKDTPGILPAYHMNKQHWISLVLGADDDAAVVGQQDTSPDALLPDSQIIDLIDASYAITR